MFQLRLLKILWLLHDRDPARSATYVEGWEERTALNQTTGRYEPSWFNPNYSSHSKLSIGKLDKLEVRHELDLNTAGHTGAQHFKILANGAEQANVILLGVPGLKQKTQLIDMAAYDAGLHSSQAYKNFVELQKKYTLTESAIKAGDVKADAIKGVEAELMGAMNTLQQAIITKQAGTLTNYVADAAGQESQGLFISAKTLAHFNFSLGVQTTSAEVAAGRKMTGEDQISGMQNIAYMVQSLTEMFTAVDEKKFGGQAERKKILEALQGVVEENVKTTNIPAYINQRAGMTARIEQLAFQQGMAEAAAEGMETLGSAAGAEVWAISKSFLAKAATKLF
jgi:hypothetical protein